jgi:hypothetical protein
MIDYFNSGFGASVFYPGKTDYANEVLDSINQQEFYDEIIKHLDTEVFDDIMDFMQYYSPDWYKYLGSWASEFIYQHISDYIDFYYNPSISRINLLTNLYCDLNIECKKYYSAYEIMIEINLAYQWKSSNEENEV